MPLEREDIGILALKEKMPPVLSGEQQLITKTPAMFNNIGSNVFLTL
ncbi:hypothetical protein J7M23_03930 [Candidatus Sumerlaeota bacterium]|nr:hypothetical protein [Candidatus Sumerlaeota bacterium]